MGVYVIGLTPEWVEFRQSISPPKTVKSEISRTIRVPSGWPLSARGRLEDRAVTLRVVSHEGGKSIGTMERSRYLVLCKTTYHIEPVKTGECALATEELANDIHTDMSWRRKNLIV